MNLLLIRGLPGVGKTTAAERMGAVVVSADDFMVDAEGKYAFDGNRLAHCHQACQAKVAASLKDGNDVVVANTFCQEWEVAPYRQIAVKHGATLKIISLFDGGLTDEQLATRNVHGVPADRIAAMRARYQHGLD